MRTGSVDKARSRVELGEASWMIRAAGPPYHAAMPVAPRAFVVAALVVLTGCAAETERNDRTNVLLVTLDTTRADRLGAYGYEQAHTPALDALANEGVVFDAAYSPAPMTLAAHATMMTGLLPPEHGARVNGIHRLAEGVPTLGEWLQADGYRTGAFVAAFVLDAKFGLARGFDHYDDDLTLAYEQEIEEQLSSYRPGNLVVDATLAWLGEAVDGAPFFAWVHLYDAHYPWHPHGDGTAHPNAPTGSYDGEITFADGQVGRLVAYLDAHGLRENTLVMVVADHGEGLGDHHEIEHAYLLDEEVLRVPWIVRGPGVKRGHRVDALVTLEDLQPTLLDLLGIDGSITRGRSLAPALRGAPIVAGVSYAETELPWTAYRWAPQYSLTTEAWKYVRTPRTELYDRARDRAEYANLAETKRDVVERLDAQLTALEQTFVVRESELATVSNEELEQLAALGYAAGSAAQLPDARADLADVKQRLATKDLATKLRQGVALELVTPVERIELAQRIVTESPETPAFHNMLGEAFVAANLLREAIPSFEQALELAPTDAGLHYSLGDTLQLVERTDEARVHLEMALELEPDMAAAHVGMGNVLRAEGRPDVAAGEYSEALRLRPDYPEAHYNLAHSFLDRGMAAPAIENFERALAEKPGWGLAHAQLANLYLTEGPSERAAPHFDAALRVFPDDVDLLNDYGVLLVALGQPNLARDQYVRAIELRPDFYRPHVNFADLAFDYGNDQNALLRYEEALRLAPHLAETPAKLARFLATTPNEAFRDGPRAVNLAELAVERSEGKSAPMLDTLAIAYACAGRFSDAIPVAQRARKRAEFVGEAAYANAIGERLELFANGQAFVATRIGSLQAPEAE